jgi:hypothetical protein
MFSLTANALSLPQRDEPAPETPLAESAKRYAGLHAEYQEAWKTEASRPSMTNRSRSAGWQSLHPSLAAFILIPGARVPGTPYRVRLNSIHGWSLGTMLEVPDVSSITIGTRKAALEIVRTPMGTCAPHTSAGKPDRTYL